MSNNKCPYCGAPGGGAASCGSCGHHLKKSSNEGRSNSGGGVSPQGGGGCFPGYTQVATPAGPRAIETLREGDHVNTVKGARRVLKVRHYGYHPLISFTLANGKTISSTPKHSFWVADGWKPARKISRGDFIKIRSEKGAFESMQVAECVPQAPCGEVYNLIVDGDFTFIAEGAITHSFTHFRVPRMIIWTLVAWMRRDDRAAVGRPVVA